MRHGFKYSESMISTCFPCLFNNYLDFTVSSLLTHGSKSEILCIETVYFFTLSFMRNLFLKNSVFIPIHVFWELVWLCLSPGGCYLMVFKFRWCVLGSGGSNLGWCFVCLFVLFFQNNLWGKITWFYLTLRKSGV